MELISYWLKLYYEFNFFVIWRKFSNYIQHNLNVILVLSCIGWNSSYLKNVIVVIMVGAWEYMTQRPFFYTVVLKLPCILTNYVYVGGFVDTSLSPCFLSLITQYIITISKPIFQISPVCYLANDGLFTDSIWTSRRENNARVRAVTRFTLLKTHTNENTNIW